MGLNDDDLCKLENMLLCNPKAGVVIPHLTGARKVKLALPGRGKSGGARVVYIDVVICEKIHLLIAYPKNVQTDLTSDQRATLKRLISTLKEE